ncbi:MAG: FG-GAP repeat protein, partial [Candidatus Glassbacteria bacterium]
LPSDGDTNDWYSYSLIVSDNVALIGALYNDDIYIDTGAAYVFEIGESNGMTPTPDVNDKERSGRTTGILRPEAKSEPAAAVRFAE